MKKKTMTSRRSRVLARWRPEMKQVGGAGPQLAGEEDDGGGGDICSDSVGEEGM
jgi:hypothetical protein